MTTHNNELDIIRPSLKELESMNIPFYVFLEIKGKGYVYPNNMSKEIYEFIIKRIDGQFPGLCMKIALKQVSDVVDAINKHEKGNFSLN